MLKWCSFNLKQIVTQGKKIHPIYTWCLTWKHQHYIYIMKPSLWYGSWGIPLICTTLCDVVTLPKDSSAPTDEQSRVQKITTLLQGSCVLPHLLPRRIPAVLCVWSPWLSSSAHTLSEASCRGRRGASKTYGPGLVLAPGRKVWLPRLCEVLPDWQLRPDWRQVALPQVGRGHLLP